MKKWIFLALYLCLSACATQPSTENTTAAAYNVQLGLGYLAQGDRARAKEKLLRASTQAPDSVDTHLALAYYYQQSAQTEQAAQAYQHALNLTPDAGQVNNNYGAFLCAEGDYAQALSYFERALTDPHYTKTATAYENAALCAGQFADLETMQRYVNAALQQDPDQSQVLLKVSVLLAQQSHYLDALDYLQRYHAQVPPTPQTLAYATELTRQLREEA